MIFLILEEEDWALDTMTSLTDTFAAVMALSW